jgi:hypothetical protein
MSPSLTAAWPALELLAGSAALAPQWQRLMEQHFPAFNRLCLRPTTWLALSVPCPRNCGCRHWVVVRHDHSGAVGLCRCTPPSCPDLDVTLGEITPYELNKPTLASALRVALGLSSQRADLPLPETVQVGAWSSAAVPAVLTIRNHPEAFRRVIAELYTRLQRPFILLAPTALNLDAHAQELLTHARAGFFPLDATTILTDDGRLLPAKPPGELFAQFTPEPQTPAPAARPRPRYALRKGLGLWHLIFDGEEAQLRHERGIFYVAWLLYNPPEEPIHALDLAAKVPEIYRQQLGLGALVDAATGKAVTLESAARIQERCLALDDAQGIRTLLQKEKELEAILDSEHESEPVKAEALRELEAIADFQRRHGRESRDSAARAVRAVRGAISRFREHLRCAVGQDGGPHPILGAFAEHVERHILIPSARYSGHGGRHAREGLAGRFTYERPTGVCWEA